MNDSATSSSLHTTLIRGGGGSLSVFKPRKCALILRARVVVVVVMVVAGSSVTSLPTKLRCNYHNDNITALLKAAAPAAFKLSLPCVIALPHECWEFLSREKDLQECEGIQGNEPMQYLAKVCQACYTSGGQNVFSCEGKKTWGGRKNYFF